MLLRDESEFRCNLLLQMVFSLFSIILGDRRWLLPDISFISLVPSIMDDTCTLVKGSINWEVNDTQFELCRVLCSLRMTTVIWCSCTNAIGAPPIQKDWRFSFPSVHQLTDVPHNFQSPIVVCASRDLHINSGCQKRYHLSRWLPSRLF
jgi:hypothetical protein